MGDGKHTDGSINSVQGFQGRFEDVKTIERVKDAMEAVEKEGKGRNAPRATIPQDYHQADTYGKSERPRSIFEGIICLIKDMNISI